MTAARRRPLIALTCLLLVVAAVFLPGLTAKQALGDDPSPHTFQLTFDYLERLPGVEFDARSEVELRLAGTGGTPQPVRCRRLRRLPGLPSKTGWLCVTLTADGERFVAGWIAAKPTDKPQDLILVDRDPETRPNALGTKRR